MNRLFRLALVSTFCAVPGCYEGVDAHVDPDRSGERPPPTSLDEIEHVDQLPALEGEDALREIAREIPPVDQYEFVGYARLEGEPLWVHDEEPEGTVGEVLAAAGIKLGDALQGLELPPGLEETDAARGILVSADGRVFIERLDAFEARLRHIANMPEDGMSGPGDEGWTPPGMEVHRSALWNPSDPAAGGIHGSDQRTPITSTSYPERAVGVAIVRPQANSGSVWSGQIRWVGRGSGGMIGPRAVMTAAHVISSNNNVVVTAAAPGKRGTSWNGDDDDWGPGLNYHSSSKFPYGARRVVWYYWNTGYDGHPRYDYGALILQDLAWSPGWIRAGHQSTSWLDYRKGWYMFGYPGGSCANSFDGDGTCGAYMYRIKGETRDVYTNYAIHWLDTQPGQSGAVIYYLKNNDRVAYLINHGNCDGVRDCGVAKKLRSGSYNSICSIVNSYPSSFFSQSDCD